MHENLKANFLKEQVVPNRFLMLCSREYHFSFLFLQGTLNDGRVIAVKQLSVASHQGNSQFITEIATISAVQHRNLVKLYGCCIEGNKKLIVKKNI